MSDTKPVVATQFLREKRWVPTTRKEALRLILEEMPETDAEGTLAYILSETNKGKTVTLGECRFAPLNRS
ncbi:MAG: hypothetical protein L3J47_05970 [Sulfurovum sp.]|nr:hypothetical protein [Sulfurovum sp.]